MSTEPASLIPLMKGVSEISSPSLLLLLSCRQCKHLALIGDHKQLPPIVISPDAQSGGFDISLFERLTSEGGTCLHRYILRIAHQLHRCSLDHVGHTVQDASCNFSISIL